MNRLNLVKLVGEAARVERLTAHLRINGKPFHSLALELAAEKEKDPLRPLKEAKP